MNDYKEKYQRLANLLIDQAESLTPEDIIKKKEYTEQLKHYLALYGKSLEDDYSEIIPREFELSGDTNTKLKILEDCIQSQKEITESKYFIDLLEGEKIPEAPPTKQV